MQTLGSSAVIDFDLGSGTTDSLTLTSTFPLEGGSSQLNFRFSNLGGTRAGVAYPLLNFAGGSIGVSVSEFGFDAQSTTAGYRGSFALSNNVLSVTFTNVPEPGTWALLLLGAASLAWRLRRTGCAKR